MELKKIYAPIQQELDKVDGILRETFKRTKNNSIQGIVNYLLESPGKRIRPALVILSAKAAVGGKPRNMNNHLIRIASAIELIHMASLIHDDVIDHCPIRHHRATINSKWGQDVSIVLGDYLYSLAFKLIAACDNIDILDCISSATEALCEGELIQVAQRGNLSLSRRRYIVIVKKKTASLFAASCEVGAIAFDCPNPLQQALKRYGLNFGIGFQMIDDYLNIMSTERQIGKPIGLDIRVGEPTLPLLFLSGRDQETLRDIFVKARNNKKDMASLKRLLINAGVPEKTKRVIAKYTDRAKESLSACEESEFKESLIALVDLVLKFPS